MHDSSLLKGAVFTCIETKLLNNKPPSAPSLQMALVVAILNIKIPLELGGLVNTVASLTPGQGMDNYMERLTRPGLRLCVLYLTQVSALLSAHTVFVHWTIQWDGESVSILVGFP